MTNSMAFNFSSRPVVLCFSGLDPSGGAGIQADIESLSATGCHAAPIVTCVTAQNTQTVHSWHPISPGMLTQQARMIFDDMQIAAIKIGMIGTLENLEVIEQLVYEHPDIPVVLDPVLASGTGQILIQRELQQALLEKLVPLTTVLTPNTIELKKLLSHTCDTEGAAFQILSRGCEAVCVTGGHGDTPKIRNRLWQDYQLIYDRAWERIAGEFHGSGCTFAASIAGHLAHGMSIQHAVIKADEFTWQAISRAENRGKGQAIPNRTFWLTNSPARPKVKHSVLTH